MKLIRSVTCSSFSCCNDLELAGGLLTFEKDYSNKIHGILNTSSIGCVKIRTSMNLLVVFLWWSYRFRGIVVNLKKENTKRRTVVYKMTTTYKSDSKRPPPFPPPLPETLLLLASECESFYGSCQKNQNVYVRYWIKVYASPCHMGPSLHVRLTNQERKWAKSVYLCQYFNTLFKSPTSHRWIF